MVTKRNKRFPYIRLVVAAIILFLIGMTISKIISKKGQKNVSLNELENYIHHEATRNSLTNQLLTSAQQEAYNKYAIRDFNAAKPLLKNLWESERDTLSLYYLGISQWYDKDKKKAKEILSLPFFADYKKPY